MKKILLIVFILTACFIANAQDATVEKTVAIANEDLNVVYRGYKNQLSIAVAGVPDADLIVTSDSATITREGEYWMCKVFSTHSSEITINVYANIKGKKQLMESKTFRVRHMPTPQAYIKLASGGLWTSENGAISRDKFEGASVVAEYDSYGYFKSQLTVRSFTLTISDGEGGFTVIKSDGNKFSKKQIEAINKMKSGTPIALTGIEYNGAVSGKGLPFSPLILE